MPVRTDIPVGSWVKHDDFGVGQVVEDRAHTRAWQTTVLFPVRPENPNTKVKKRRVMTATLKPIEKPR